MAARHHTCANQEGRTLLHEPLVAADDIRVCDRSELGITLTPLSSPHERALCIAPEALCSWAHDVMAAVTVSVAAISEAQAN
jgi:hypothetical protein